MTSLTSTRLNTLCRSVVFAAGAFVFASAHAASVDPLDPVQLDEITVSAPAVKSVDRAASGASIQEVTVTAAVQADPAALATEYGALMLKYSVREAARKACDQADPSTTDDGTCYKNALESAKSQVDAAIAQARSTAQN
jgi:UrcA family protein